MSVELKITFTNLADAKIFFENYQVTEKDIARKVFASVQSDRDSLNKKLAAKTLGIEAPTVGVEVVAEPEITEVKEEPKPELPTYTPVKTATYEDVKDAVMLVSRTKGRDAAVSCLDKFGYKKVTPEMREEHYVGLVNVCKRTAAGL